MEPCLPAFSDILSNAHDDRPDLSKADPEDFRDYDRWFRFMVRCFHSGITREDFIAWCVADPAYGGDAKKIGRHWDSLERRKQANV
jgi:hypothetical protein